MSLTNLKRIARYKVRREEAQGDEELIDFLKDWWGKKYKLPNNHPLLLQKTLEELIVEYYTDVFETNPDELRSFETQVGEKIPDSDEEWFERMMGDEYNSANVYSDEYNSKRKSKRSAVPDEFEDLYTLGK